MNCAIVGALFRPLEPTLVVTEDDEDGEDEKKELNANLLLASSKNGKNGVEMKKSASFASIPENAK